MGLQERDFFTDKTGDAAGQLRVSALRPAQQLRRRWVRRTKKPRLPQGADERDRAMYAKLRDYLVRIDDNLTCKTCQKKFEIPSHQSLVFVDDIPTGLPKDEDLED